MAKTDDLLATAGESMLESLGGGINKPQTAPTSPPKGNHSVVQRMRLTKDYEKARNYPLDHIERDPNNPRKHFPEDEHERLVRSIDKYGLLVPIALRWVDEKQRWMIIAGERRYRAVLALGKKHIPGVEHENDANSVVVKQIVENCLRRDINPMERADAVKQLMDIRKYQPKEVAECLSMSTSYVSETLLLHNLSAEDQDKIRTGKLSFKSGVAKARALSTTKIPKRTTKFEREIRTDDMVAKLKVTVDKADADEHDLLELLQAYIDAATKAIHEARVVDAA